MLFVRKDTSPGTSLGVVSRCWQGSEYRFVKPRPWGLFCRHGWIYSCFSAMRMWWRATVPNPLIELIGPDTTANLCFIRICDGWEEKVGLFGEFLLF